MKNLILLFIAFLLLQFTSLGQDGWVQQNSGTTVDLNTIYFVDDVNGWVVGDSSVILMTTNAGTVWTSQTSGISEGNNLESVYFIDENIGWIVGDDPDPWSSNGFILKTTNGGVNWNLMVDTISPLYSIQFLDHQLGWAAGLDDIYITNDGGTTWENQLPYTGMGYYISISFIDENNGWVAGRTEDGWPMCAKTTNGGTDWEWQGGVGSHFGKYVTFVDDLVGWMICTKTWRTTDGGHNWEDRGEGGECGFFLDENYGYIIKKWPYQILYTTNGGVDWIDDSSGTNNNLNSIFFITNSTGYVVGENGVILKTTDGGISFVEENEIDKVPTEFNLTQNYPNPFNPSTKIRYSVPQTSNVIVKVYDVLGNEIETLVNKEKEIGTYELTWSAENLTSGIYFYRLQAGDFVETKKMILMK